MKEGEIERGNLANLGREEKLEESQLVNMRSLDLMFDLDVFKLTWLSYEVISWNFTLISLKSLILELRILMGIWGNYEGKEKWWSWSVIAWTQVEITSKWRKI